MLLITVLAICVAVTRGEMFTQSMGQLATSQASVMLSVSFPYSPATNNTYNPNCSVTGIEPPLGATTIWLALCTSFTTTSYEACIQSVRNTAIHDRGNSRIYQALAAEFALRVANRTNCKSFTIDGLTHTFFPCDTISKDPSVLMSDPTDCITTRQDLYGFVSCLSSSTFGYAASTDWWSLVAATQVNSILVTTKDACAFRYSAQHTMIDPTSLRRTKRETGHPHALIDHHLVLPIEKHVPNHHLNQLHFVVMRAVDVAVFLLERMRPDTIREEDHEELVDAVFRGKNISHIVQDMVNGTKYHRRKRFVFGIAALVMSIETRKRQDAMAAATEKLADSVRDIAASQKKTVQMVETLGSTVAAMSASIAENTRVQAEVNARVTKGLDTLSNTLKDVGNNLNLLAGSVAASTAEIAAHLTAFQKVTRMATAVIITLIGETNRFQSTQDAIAESSARLSACMLGRLSQLAVPYADLYLAYSENSVTTAISNIGHRRFIPPSDLASLYGRAAMTCNVLARSITVSVELPLVSDASKMELFWTRCIPIQSLPPITSPDGQLTYSTDYCGPASNGMIYALSSDRASYIIVDEVFLALCTWGDYVWCQKNVRLTARTVGPRDWRLCYMPNYTGRKAQMNNLTLCNVPDKLGAETFTLQTSASRFIITAVDTTVTVTCISGDNKSYRPASRLELELPQGCSAIVPPLRYSPDPAVATISSPLVQVSDSPASWSEMSRKALAAFGAARDTELSSIVSSVMSSSSRFMANLSRLEEIAEISDFVTKSNAAMIKTAEDGQRMAESANADIKKLGSEARALIASAERKADESVSMMRSASQIGSGGVGAASGGAIAMVVIVIIIMALCVQCKPHTMGAFNKCFSKNADGSGLCDKLCPAATAAAAVLDDEPVTPTATRHVHTQPPSASQVTEVNELEERMNAVGAYRLERSTSKRKSKRDATARKATTELNKAKRSGSKSRTTDSVKDKKHDDEQTRSKKKGNSSRATTPGVSPAATSGSEPDTKPTKPKTKKKAPLPPRKADDTASRGGDSDDDRTSMIPRPEEPADEPPVEDTDAVMFNVAARLNAGYNSEPDTAELITSTPVMRLAATLIDDDYVTAVSAPKQNAPVRQHDYSEIGSDFALKNRDILAGMALGFTNSILSMVRKPENGGNIKTVGQHGAIAHTANTPKSNRSKLTPSSGTVAPPSVNQVNSATQQTNIVATGGAGMLSSGSTKSVPVKTTPIAATSLSVPSSTIDRTPEVTPGTRGANNARTLSPIGTMSTGGTNRRASTFARRQNQAGTLNPDSNPVRVGSVTNQSSNAGSRASTAASRSRASSRASSADSARQRKAYQDVLNNKSAVSSAATTPEPPSKRSRSVSKSRTPLRTGGTGGPTPTQVTKKVTRKLYAGGIVVTSDEGPAKETLPQLAIPPSSDGETKYGLRVSVSVTDNVDVKPYWQKIIRLCPNTTLQEESMRNIVSALITLQRGMADRSRAQAARLKNVVYDDQFEATYVPALRVLGASHLIEMILSILSSTAGWNSDMTGVIRYSVAKSLSSGEEFAVKVTDFPVDIPFVRLGVVFEVKTGEFIDVTSSKYEVKTALAK